MDAPLLFYLSLLYQLVRQKQRTIEYWSNSQVKLAKILIKHARPYRAMGDVLYAINAGEIEKAKVIASSRLSWSSFVNYENNEIAKYLPIPMRKMVEQMYEATGKFIWLVQNASVEESAENYQNLFDALINFTTTCRSC